MCNYIIWLPYFTMKSLLRELCTHPYVYRPPLLPAGIGWTMFVVSFISSIYYNMLIAYSLFYIIASFASDVPWRGCDNWWNTPGRSRLELHVSSPDYRPPAAWPCRSEYNWIKVGICGFYTHV